MEVTIEPVGGERRHLCPVHVQPQGRSRHRSSPHASTCSTATAPCRGRRGRQRRSSRCRSGRTCRAPCSSRDRRRSSRAAPSAPPCASCCRERSGDPGLERHARRSGRARRSRGSVTEAFVPLKESAFPNRPAVAPAHVAFVSVPLLPLPDPSATAVPLPVVESVGGDDPRRRAGVRDRDRHGGGGRSVGRGVTRDGGDRVRAVRHGRRVPGERVRRARVLGCRDPRRRA